MKDAFLLVNPASGRGRGRDALRRIEREFRRAGLSWEVGIGQKREDLRSVCRSAKQGYNAWVVVGGDGTVNEVLQEAHPDGPALAIWPAGTANLLAREVGFGPDAAGLARAIRSGRTRLVDLGLCAWPGRDLPARRFAACVGAGLDARIVASLAGRRRGAIRWTAYAKPFLAALSASPARIRVTMDGRSLEEGTTIVISNLTRYAGVLKVAPRARFDDGLLDLCVFGGGAPADVFRHFALAVTGRHVRFPDVQYVQGRSFRLEAGCEVPVQVDGDAYGALPVTVEVLAAGLRAVRMDGGSR